MCRAVALESQQIRGLKRGDTPDLRHRQVLAHPCRCAPTRWHPRQSRTSEGQLVLVVSDVCSGEYSTRDSCSQNVVASARSGFSPSSRGALLQINTVRAREAEDRTWMFDGDGAFPREPVHLGKHLVP
jgi:hypothetical protein